MTSAISAAHQRYDEQVQRLLAELKPVASAALHQAPAEGAWSALQTVQHLILVEEASLAYIRKKLSFNPELPEPTWVTYPKMLLLQVTLWSPIKFKAPKSAGNEQIIAAVNLEDLQARWLKIRGEWTDFLTQMPPELQDKAVYRHPRVGLISWTQMLNFLAWHLLRHRKQIQGAIQAAHR